MIDVSDTTWNGYSFGGEDTGRKGGWISTYTGRRFFPLDPDPEQIDIHDIAHALARQCRFSGHCREFYSVAEHSVRVAEMCPPRAKLHGLLHDASEAYLVDLPRPLKRTPGFAEGYLAAEEVLQLAVYGVFDVPTWDHEVEIWDQALLATERRDLMPDNCHWEVPGATPLTIVLRPWTPEQAELSFLRAFHRYTVGS